MNTSAQQQQAEALYFSTNQTQQQIADAVGISDRTIRAWIKKYSWQKLKRAAISAPAIMVENMCSQVVELQNHIASREEGKRFPTLQEAETTRKLITCIQKLNFYPSLGAKVQVMKSFMEFTALSGDSISMELAVQAKRFFENSSAYHYAPYEIEFGLDMYPFANRLEDEDKLPYKEQADLKAEAACPDYFGAEASENEKPQAVENEYIESENAAEVPLQEAEKSGTSRSFRGGNPEAQKTMTLTQQEQRYRGKNGERVILLNGKKYLQDKYGRIKGIWQAPSFRQAKERAHNMDR